MRKQKVLTPEQQEEIRTKDFFDMILPSTVKFMSDHYIVGDSYRCVWVIREYPPSTEEQAILSQLADRNGVTLRIYPVYDFIKKKQAEGKACKVAKIAGFNKFLRIYYARVMEVYQ
mgnify:CR=1 FL=1